MAREITVKPSSQASPPDDISAGELTPIRGRRIKAREAVLTKAEFYAMLKAAQTPAEKCLLALGVLGLRASEIVNMESSWIDPVAKVITVPDRVAKRRHGRRVPYGGIKLLATIIESYFLGSFMAKLPWTTRQGVFKATKRLAKLTGIQHPVTPHGLRATGATWFAEAGWTAEELRQHFGWTKIKTADHYIESSGAAAERAMTEKGDKIL